MVVHSLKVITDVTLHGFNKLKDPNLLNFLHFLLVRLKNFAECRASLIYLFICIVLLLLLLFSLSALAYYFIHI
jgi:hypothetical protein